MEESLSFHLAGGRQKGIFAVLASSAEKGERDVVKSAAVLPSQRDRLSFFHGGRKRHKINTRKGT